MKQHRHRAWRTIDRAYRYCLTPDRCHPESHGWVERVEECRCGATRSRNVNRKVENGRWNDDRN